MSKENRRVIMYLGMIFLAVVITYKLPHDSYALINYIIQPIKVHNSILYLSVIVPLLLIAIGIRGIWGLEKFAHKNRILIVLFILVFIIPFMKWTIEFARINYHSLINDGIASLDIEESNISLGSNESTIMNISLKVKNYNRSLNEFQVRVYLPKSLSELTGKDYYDLDQYYFIAGSNNVLTINEDIVLELESNEKLNDFYDTYWYYEDVRYQLYDDKETINIIKHGY